MAESPHYKELLQALNEYEVEYLIVGGYAVMNTRSRATRRIWTCGFATRWKTPQGCSMLLRSSAFRSNTMGSRRKHSPRRASCIRSALLLSASTFSHGSLASSSQMHGSDGWRALFLAFPYDSFRWTISSPTSGQWAAARISNI